MTKSNLVLRPIHGIFSANSVNQEDNQHVRRLEPIGGEATCGHGVTNQEQFVKWATAITSQNANTWFEVKRLTFFSCYDFRLGFHLNMASESEGTDNPPATISLDDVKINVEETLIGKCDSNVCKNNGRCFKFEGNPVCCCPPGFKV